MKSKVKPLIILAFLLTGFPSLALFGFSYSIIINRGTIPGINVLAPIFLFGVLGLWAILVIILRTKRIIISDSTIIIKRIFTLKSYEYQIKDIVAYFVTERIELYNYYTLLRFTTNDEIVHSVVSYELTNFNEIVQYFQRNEIKFKKISIWKFIKTEYGLAFVLSCFIILVLMIGVQIIIT